MSAGRALAEMYGPETDDPIELALYQAQRQVLGFQAALAEAEADRDRVVRDALRAGWTQQQVCARVGLSQQRIGQIGKGVSRRGRGRPRKERNSDGS